MPPLPVYRHILATLHQTFYLQILYLNRPVYWDKDTVEQLSEMAKQSKYKSISQIPFIIDNIGQRLHWIHKLIIYKRLFVWPLHDCIPDYYSVVEQAKKIR